MVASIDVSREAQLRDIEASFQACNEKFSLESLQHPNKPNVTALESYAVLPDVDIWANQYDLFRFSERPGERPVDVCHPFPPQHDNPNFDLRLTTLVSTVPFYDP
jgi:RNA polymerase II-associated factor 1